MDIRSLHRQMTHYNRWKRQLDERLQRFEQWSQQHDMAGANMGKTLQRARQLLRGESFTIACVGEFSRGKTELINALLYTGGGRRLLPSQPGRTTMCPTEIFWDHHQPANCVRLLPIETRRTNTSLQSFKRIPQNWVAIHFDAQDHEQTRAAINQVSASKQVSVADAIKLGFAQDELGERDENGMVTVPAWRHALISLDHPLLRQGLRIVDTPGLNALGNEPELTLKTLPDAQAILFLLSADAGVTASDMDIWREHIQLLRDNNCTAVIALLNKIDSLWDDLTPAQEIEANIDQLRKLTAHQLSLSPEHVVALSAKQGLLGKVGRNQAQLARSNFPQLERMLAECVLRNQQQIIGHRLIGDSYAMVINARNSLQRRLAECEQECNELRAVAPEAAAEKLNELRDSIRRSHHEYHKQALSLRTSQRLLDSQKLSLLGPISSGLLERQIAEAHANLAQSWTTVGLARAIGKFFDDVDNNLRHLEREIERCNRLLTSIYERPEQGLSGDDLIMRHLLKIQKQRRQLNQLHARADDFRKSLSTVFTHKGALISRFINTLVQEVRSVYADLNQHITHWLQEALAPLFHQNQYQKQLLEHHMLRLTQLQTQRNSHAEQVEVLQRNIYQLQTALGKIEPLYKELMTAPLEPESMVDLEPKDAMSAQVVSISQGRHGVSHR
ncbi:dynamin-like GTPase family protein [Cellvibrio sp. NN19]|uniref:dynamin-like GTPase family protein n=1 Tax=Cellvibrio chitinivorans TaxID=3102792 RepID=UPI002B416814|nr:dynamin family protein [Cellvibrio sp. NN19]